MWNKENMVLITNNSKVYDKYKEEMEVIYLNSYGDVLLKGRDLIHSGHELLTHPQASSLKPNQTPFRSILLYAKKPADGTKSILLMEKCIEAYEQWQAIARTPDHYDKKVEDDFKTIDLSVIENIMQRIG